MIVGVDFDGTCVVHEYPKVGEDVEGAVTVLKWLVAEGQRIILWTMRDGDELNDAEHWFAERGIPLYGVNENPTQGEWTTSPKAYCHAYVDDAAIGCPLVELKGKRPRVDWWAVQRLLEKRLAK